ncbi:MAG: hypothetical protein WA484_02955 [Solirubrobacteraceae bacterium]
MDGDDTLLVQPYALEDEREELALGGGVCLSGPEDREVLEHLAGLVEVGEGAGGELGKLCVDCLAAGHVLGTGEVAKLIEIARARRSSSEERRLTVSAVSAVAVPARRRRISSRIPGAGLKSAMNSTSSASTTSVWTSGWSRVCSARRVEQ